MAKQFGKLVLLTLISIMMVFCQSNDLQDSQNLPIKHIQVQQTSLGVNIPEVKQQENKEQQQIEQEEEPHNLQQKEQTGENEQKTDASLDCQNGLIEYLKNFISSIQEQKQTRIASYNQLNLRAQKQQQFEFALIQLSDILRSLQLMLKIEQGKSCGERSKIIERADNLKINSMVQVYQNRINSAFPKID